MARGKRKQANIPKSLSSSELGSLSRQKTQVMSVRAAIGRHPSANFLPFQEADLVDRASIVASEEHRALLELDIKATVGKITSLRWFQEMEIPGLPEGVRMGTSSTDMHGNVTIYTYEKETKAGKYDPIDRAICIEGNEEHEKLHCVLTDPYTFDKFVEELKALEKKGGDEAQMAHLLHRFQNILEDGRIETYSRDHNMARYSYLLGLAALDPVLPDAEDFKEDKPFPAPKEGYVPCDVTGKALKKGPDGQFILPQGQKVSMWGNTPFGLSAQISAALSAYTLPEYTVGPLHPKVQACFDECQPYLDAAVAGNSADCIDASYNLYAIIKKHDLLPEVKEMQGGATMIMMPGGNPMPGGFGMPISAPEGMQFAQSPGQGGQGQSGEQPQNPMPSADGKPQMSQGLSDQLGLGGGAEGDKEGKEEKEGEGSGGAKGKEKDDKKGQGASGAKGDKDGDEKGEGKDGKDGKEKGEGQGKGNSPYTPGAASGFGGYDPNAAIPTSSNQLAQQQIKAIRDQMKTQLDQAVSNANNAAQISGRGKSKAIKWKTPQHFCRIEDMRKGTIQKALQDETNAFHKTGQRLAENFRQIKSKYAEDKTNLRYGRLDRRRMPRAMAGNMNVMKRVQIKAAGDIEIDVVFDLSGSTCGDREDQYRSGMMFAIAGQRAKIPVAIYGGDEGHYEFKRRDETDFSGLSCIFQAGGGGTPAAPWIEFQRARLALSSAEHKWAFIITDGGSFDPELVREQIVFANKEGIKVFGLTYQCDPQMMNRQFGPGNWASINDYLKAPDIAWGLIKNTLKTRLGV